MTENVRLSNRYYDKLNNNLQIYYLLFCSSSISFAQPTKESYSQMSNEQVQPFNVIYDIERDKYFRVNKITGDIQPSSKTGKLPAKFDPSVTGTDYIARKKPILFKALNSRKIGQKINDLANTRKYQTETSEKPVCEINQLFNNAHQDIQNVLPKLNKTSSQSSFEKEKISNAIVNPSIFHQIRISKPKNNQKLSPAQKENNKSNDSFLNSMTKLVLSSDRGNSQGRMKTDGFGSKLRRYSEIQKIKLHQNNVDSVGNSQNSQRIQFIEKSLLTSVLDESHISLEPRNRLNVSSVNQKYERNTVSKSEVVRAMDQLQKQRQSLFLLTKKYQDESPRFKRNSKDSGSNYSQVGFKTVNLKYSEQQQRLKTQLQKQKLSFLSFYPKYIFRQNPRLIQQQKDRKINLKKLEESYLENNQKKFGKIYKEGDEMK